MLSSHPFLKSNNTQIWYNKDSPIVLYCPLEGVPKVNKIWYFNGIKIIPNGNWSIDKYYNLIFSRGLTENLQGTYVCNASNEFGRNFLKYNAKLAGFFNFDIFF